MVWTVCHRPSQCHTLSVRSYNMPNASTCKVEATLAPIIGFREIMYGAKYLKTHDYVTAILLLNAM